MQRIRNKRLQKKYIDFSVTVMNVNKDFFNYKNLDLFNYFTLVSYKYYLARRANNVL